MLEGAALPLALPLALPAKHCHVSNSGAWPALLRSTTHDRSAGLSKCLTGNLSMGILSTWQWHMWLLPASALSSGSPIFCSPLPAPAAARHATACAGAYRWVTSGLKRRCRCSHSSQSAQSSPLGRCLRAGWGEVQEVRSVPPPSSSDGGGTGRSSSGRRRLGGGSTAGGVSALQTVRHDHLEPQTRVPIPPLLTHTEILTCVSHHSHSRRSLDIRRQLRLYGARLQGR